MKVVDDRKSARVYTFKDLFVGQAFVDKYNDNIFIKTREYNLTPAQRFNAVNIETGDLTLFEYDETEICPVNAEVRIKD